MANDEMFLKDMRDLRWYDLVSRCLTKVNEEENIQYGSTFRGSSSLINDLSTSSTTPRIHPARPATPAVKPDEEHSRV